MPESLLLVAACLCSLSGMAWLALTMKVHWQQVRGNVADDVPGQSLLRGLGVAGLAGSLLLCLRADHPSMAVLVWVMTLAASALTVAFVLSFRPRWLVWLAPWARD